jgi:hypothetical protein
MKTITNYKVDAANMLNAHQNGMETLAKKYYSILPKDQHARNK